jgi:hypothetical protein
VTISIPTGDLTGLLGDTIPFASPDKDLPSLHAIRLHWDGGQLHAQATDRLRVAWSTWDPDDDPDGDEDVQDDLFTDWGGADDPWEAVLPFDDAKHLVATYKLGVKEQRVPLTVDMDVERGQIRVARSRETGHSAITTTVRTPLVEFPNIRAYLADSAVAGKVDSIAYTAKFVADFAKVRQRGPLELTFTGSESPTLVTIGKRFVGAIMPVKRGAGNGEG